MGDGVQLRRRKFVGVFLLALLLAMALASVTHLIIPYQKGGVNLYYYVYNANNRWGFEDYRQHFGQGALPVGWQGPTFLVVGAAVTVLLTFLRTTLAWFPLHPLGYALASSWTMIVFWFSALVSWAIKALVLRYGGMRLYRQARPFFLGLILGEFTMALFWTLANFLLDIPTPAFPWA
jgi:hypothetical protein